MKNLFFCFTPYHVRVSNCLAKRLKNDSNYIITFKNSNINTFINTKFFEENSSFFTDRIEKIKVKEYLLNWKYIKDTREEYDNFYEYVNNINPDNLFIFSDNAIYFQKILSKINSKVILVEEGTALYLNCSKYTIKEKIGFEIMKRLVYRYSNAKLFTHGKGGYEDFILAREPELLDNNSKKIKMTKEFIREVFYNYKKIKLEEGYLYSPAGTIYNKNKMLLITEYIFKLFYENNIILYVKLHPREVYENDIVKLSKKYKEYVKIIDDKKITSEDIILSENIKGVISDYSSMLINAPYLRDKFEIYTTLNIMKEIYKIDIDLNISILNLFRKKGIIKNIEILEEKLKK